MSYRADKLQAQSLVKSDFEVKFDLEAGQGQSPQNNRDLNLVVLHLWFKFYDPSFNGVMRQANDNTCGPFYWHGLTSIPAWISNYIHCKVWDEITYLFLNFNGATVEV